MVNVRSIRAIAMDYLALREHSQYELAQKLQRKGFSDEEIDALLETLQSQNLLSDQRFSESYVRYRAGKGYGPVRIQQELAQRGVNKELISLSLQQFSKEDWREIANRVHEKKRTYSQQLDFRLGSERRAPGVDGWSMRTRAREANNAENSNAKSIRFLLYRGFPMQIAREVVGAQEYNLEN